MVLLVAANAFFVAAEFAMVSVRDTRIQQLIEQRRIGARTVRKIQQHLDEFLPAVQFGVTLASLGLGWVGEGTLAAVICSWLGNIPYARVYAHGLSATLAFLLSPIRSSFWANLFLNRWLWSALSESLLPSPAPWTSS